jgi:hypothetical protein
MKKKKKTDAQRKVELYHEISDFLAKMEAFISPHHREKNGVKRDRLFDDIRIRNKLIKILFDLSHFYYRLEKEVDIEQRKELDFKLIKGGKDE